MAADISAETIIAMVGEADLERACDFIRENIQLELTNPGGTHPNDEYLEMIPHNLADYWNDDAFKDCSLISKINVTFQLYRRMPAYGFIMYSIHSYKEFTPDELDLYWRRYRELLADDDDVLTWALEYLLAVDFFEDPTTVHESWKYLTQDLAAEKAIKRVLHSAGPVPWPLKKELFEKLIDDQRWHLSIFQCLIESWDMLYGDIDMPEAKVIFDQLRLSPETKHLEFLRKQIEQGAKKIWCVPNLKKKKD